MAAYLVGAFSGWLKRGQTHEIMYNVTELLRNMRTEH